MLLARTKFASKKAWNRKNNKTFVVFYCCFLCYMLLVTSLMLQINFTPVRSEIIFTPVYSEFIFTPVRSELIFTLVHTEIIFTPVHSEIIFTPVCSEIIFTPVCSEIIFTPVRSELIFTLVHTEIIFTPVRSEIIFTPVRSELKLKASFEISNRIYIIYETKNGDVVIASHIKAQLQSHTHTHTRNFIFINSVRFIKIILCQLIDLLIFSISFLPLFLMQFECLEKEKIQCIRV